MIGRLEEQAVLQDLLQSDKAEFLAVYGRRRIGKTFLIREYFHDHFAFYTTGIPNEEGITLKDQLANFHESLKKYGDGSDSAPGSWSEAFRRLREMMEGIRTTEKKVIFIDEMPWLDTQRSKFIPALDFFWNSWASARTDILLIACGSASAWMSEKLLRSSGGLHNRVTMRMHVKPFTLRECEEYYDSRHIVLSRRQMVENYMIFGGVPYYLTLFHERRGAAENIDRLFFGEDALLQGEYDILFRSLFRNPDLHKRIVSALCSVRKGMTREEILKKAKISDGGTFTSALEDLERSGFIRKYRAIGKTRRNALFQIIDPYCLFYNTYITANNDSSFWQKHMISPGHSSWSGQAFELVCLLHAEQIKAKLGAKYAVANTCCWHSVKTKPGAQIDLVIDRSDGYADACEMKYLTDEYEMEAADRAAIANRIRAFRNQTRTKKAVRAVLVTTYGLVRNEYSDIFQLVVTMDDLFSDAR